MELTEAVKELLVTTAKALKGSARWLFMAWAVQALGQGGQRLAERELGWNSILGAGASLTALSLHALVPFGFRRQVRKCFNHLRSNGAGLLQ